MHLVEIVGAVILFVAGYVFLFKSLNENINLQHEINAKLPPDRKFEPRFWWFGTWEKFRSLQSEVLPNSQRLKRSSKFRLLSFVFFLSAMALLVIGLGKLPVPSR